MIEGTPTTPKSASKVISWRKWRRIALLVVAAGALVSLGAVGGGAYESSHWQPLYTRASNELRVARNEGFDATIRAAAVQDELSRLQQNIVDKVGSLDHPTFVLWNSCGSGGPSAGCPLTAGHEYVGGVPDTFTYEINFRSTVPVTTRILPAYQYACRYTKACAWGSAGMYWAPTTDLHVVFHEAEGCADYIAIFSTTQTGTFYPDIHVTQNPASHSTGTCGK
jgi:hypothetical protein